MFLILSDQTFLKISLIVFLWFYLNEDSVIVEADAIIVRDLRDTFVGQFNRAFGHDVLLLNFNHRKELGNLLAQEGTEDLSALLVNEVYGKQLALCDCSPPCFDF